MEVQPFLVVGSGCTGAMAAQTLAEAGAQVTMLDAGARDCTYRALIPDADFLSIRRTDPDQHRYLLGDAFEGIPGERIRTGAQLTPPRRFMVELAERLLPVASDTFFPMESLAYGGLGNGWGLGCCQFSGPELAAAGLDEPAMRAAYRVVADRIGICGAHDDASPYTLGDLPAPQAPPALDLNHRLIAEAYARVRPRLVRRGFRLGRPALALLTEDRDGRRAYAYRDLDFYSDRDGSAYRPWMTVDRLRRAHAIRYVGDTLVLSFAEEGDQVVVRARDTATGTPRTFRCRRLVLASGVLGTARIVLRSFPVRARLPLLCNPYCYIPCLHLRMLARTPEERTVGFAQLALFHDPRGDNSDVAMASLYGYRSLMLFRVAAESRLNFRDGRILLQHLLPALTVVGIHHPDPGGPGRYVELEADPSSPTGDSLRAHYALPADEQRRVRRRDAQFGRAMRALGCHPLRRVDPGHGASIHYAGTLPAAGTEAPFTLSAGGRLAGTRNVYVADGSGFRYLPAKSLTWSLMANAHLVAREALVHG